MDIAKYIGLFLLKNNFCYLHGLGNLELRKKPAAYDGEALQAPQYEVVLTPTGSIDDNLANFIATNEQISISKAANALRDFSTQSRAELQEGKEVPLPAIGKFVQQNGQIRFITDPHLSYTPPSIPTLRTSKRTEEAPTFVERVEQKEAVATADHSGGPQVNWGKIVVLLVILAVVAVAAVFGVRYLNEHASTPDSTEAPVRDTAPAVPTGAPAATDTLTTDTTAATTPAAATATTTADGQLQYKVLINTYNTQAKAQRRVQQLSNLGRTVELVSIDSSHFAVVMPMTGPAADTARVIDSLGRLYGGKARIYP